MQVILASQRWLRREGGEGVREALNQDWARFLRDLGCLLVPASSGQDPRALFDALRPSALLLSGGNDLSLVNDDILSVGRDAWEVSLLEAAFDRRLPVVGVCRGMQLLVTRRGTKLKRVAGHAGDVHGLSAAPSLPDWVDGAWLERSSLPSHHHWGIGELSAPLEALAYAADGTVEAMLDHERRALGLQWHPERSQDPDRRDHQLLLSFLERYS